VIRLMLRSPRAWLPAVTAMTALAVGIPRGGISAAHARSGDDPRSAAAGLSLDIYDGLEKARVCAAVLVKDW